MLIKEGKETDYKKYVEINKDPYSSAVVRFGERWAELLEKAIETNGQPEKVIVLLMDKTAREADTEGITGFMYGCAVQALHEFWEYGDILNYYHNKSYGVDDNSGTVNPAILTIG